MNAPEAVVTPEKRGRPRSISAWSFTVVFVVTKGGPNFATNYVSYYAYSKFNTGAYGEAASVATILFALVAAVAITAYWALEREEAK